MDIKTRFNADDMVFVLHYSNLEYWPVYMVEVIERQTEEVTIRYAFLSTAPKKCVVWKDDNQVFKDEKELAEYAIMISQGP